MENSAKNLSNIPIYTSINKLKYMSIHMYTYIVFRF